jgi:hypothetical protein
MPARLRGFKDRLRYGAGIILAIAVVGGLSPTGTAQGSTQPAHRVAAGAPRAYLDESRIALPPSAELALRNAPASRSWRIVLSFAPITAAFLLIALLIVIRCRRRVTPSAENRAIAYMRVRHGHYWQPPDEPASRRPTDPGHPAAPTTDDAPGQ